VNPRLEDQHPWTRWDVLLIVPPVGLAVLGCVLVIQAGAVSEIGCQEIDPLHPVMPDFPLLFWGIVALVLGRMLGRSPRGIHLHAGARRTSDIVSILAMMLVFAALTTAFVYEAVGVRETQTRGVQIVGRVQELEPITHYVRCAIYYNTVNSVGHVGVWSYATPGTLCFLAGLWLWPLQTLPANEVTSRVHSPGPVVPIWAAALLTAVVVAAFVVASYAFLNSWFEATAEVYRQLAVYGPVTGASFREGIRGVIASAFGLFTCVAALDVFFAICGWAPVGSRVQHWARVNPGFAALLLFVLGLLLAHFVGNAIHYPQPGKFG
jgi:hypothetical protein